MMECFVIESIFWDWRPYKVKSISICSEGHLEARCDIGGVLDLEISYQILNPRA
jgi:hypothetical protein